MKLKRILFGHAPSSPPTTVKTEDRLAVFGALLQKADLSEGERRVWIERWGLAAYGEDARRKQFENDFKRTIS